MHELQTRINTAVAAMERTGFEPVTFGLQSRMGRFGALRR
jgi:hypothetical protein